MRLIKKEKAKDANVYFHMEHFEALNKIVELLGINPEDSTSKKVQQIILAFLKQLEFSQKSSNQNVKMNQIGKEVSMALNVVLNLAASLNVADHLKNEQVNIYSPVENYIEAKMNGKYKIQKGQLVSDRRQTFPSKPVDHDFLTTAKKQKEEDDLLRALRSN